MALFQQSKLHNRLLQRLDPDDFSALVRHLAPVELKKGTVLVEPHRPFAHVFFVERGLGSIVTISPDGLEIESGLFGRDGFTPAGIVMNSDRTPNRIVIQVAGDGFQIEADQLRQLMRASHSLQSLLLRYVHALHIQTSYTALSNAVHPIEERLARWLLMSHDRVGGDEMALTHEFLSLMLAVRRPSVTTSLHVLEGNHFIKAERGLITIRDRKRLEEFAGDAYGQPEAEYERLIGPLR